MLILSLYLNKNNISVNIKFTLYFLLLFLLCIFKTINIIVFFKEIVIFCYIYILLSINQKFQLSYKYEFFVLMNIILIGLLLLLNSNNFVIFLLALEIYTYGSYILISYKTQSLLSTEGGFKYLIMSSLSTGLIICGISIIYWYYGSIDFNEIYFLSQTNNFDCWIAYLLLISGILLKIGAAPFHLWYLDAYQELDFWVLAFLGILPKLCIIVILMKLCIFLNITSIFFIKYLLYIIGILSILVSNITVIIQLNIKRLLLYYAIQGNGFISFLYASSNIEHWDSIIFYVIFYSLAYLNIIILLFGIKNWITFKELNNIYNFYNLFILNKLYSWNLLLIIFNLISMPPFIFFSAKLLVLFSLNTTFFYGVVYTLMFNILSVFIYLRLMNFVFFYKDIYIQKFILPLNYNLVLIISSLLIINLISPFLINPFSNFINILWF